MRRGSSDSLQPSRASRSDLEGSVRFRGDSGRAVTAGAVAGARAELYRCAARGWGVRSALGCSLPFPALRGSSLRGEA